MISRAAYRDPRHFQIAVLSLLLGYGLFALDFGVRAAQVVVIAAVALGVDGLGSRLAGRRRFDPRSAAITALSLCLLLRTTSLETAALAAGLALGSKYLLRVDGRHLFNPSAFGLAAVLWLRDDAWLSAGQWGSAPFFGVFVACLGSLVLRRAQRSDVTWAFLGSYLGLVFGRALWLGDPLPIPLHALQSGALLIFAFFMISDPKTTPNSRAGRLLFAVLVAAGGFVVQYELYGTNGLLWSLVLAAPLIPLLDRLLPERPYTWNGTALTEDRAAGGRRHGESPPELDASLGGLATRC